MFPIVVSDNLPDLSSLSCDKSLSEQHFPTARLPSLSYTGRFTLEPTSNACSNSLWAEPLFSLVSGLVGMASTQTSAAASCSSTTSVNSSAAYSLPNLSCSIHVSEPNPIYSAARSEEHTSELQSR